MNLSIFYRISRLIYRQNYLSIIYRRLELIYRSCHILVSTAYRRRSVEMFLRVISREIIYRYNYNTDIQRLLLWT